MKFPGNGLAAALALGAAAPVFADYLVVVTRGEDSIAIVDMETMMLARTTSVGANPHEAWGSPDGERVFVSDYGMSQGTTVSVVNVHSGAIEDRWELGENTGPHGIQASADGRVVWVTAERAQQVLELDSASGEILRRWATDQRGSHQLIADAQGERIFVANIPENTVAAIDRGNDGVTLIATDVGPEGLDISPDGSQLWVGNRHANTISIIDTATLTVVDTIASEGEVPFRLKFTPDGREVWVVNVESNRVTIFDTASREVIGHVEMERIPVGIFISPHGDQVFIAHTAEDTVSVIDRDTREVVQVITVGQQPDGMAYVVTD